MKSVVRTLLTLALAVVIASPLLAADGKRGKKAPPKPQDPAEMILKSLEKAELTDEQVSKIKEMAAKTAEKVKAVEEKAALTPEQKQARQEAQKKAKDEGKTSKEAGEAVMAAMNLSDAQKEAMKEVGELRAELKKQAVALLTPEQKEKAGVKEGRKKANR